MGVVDMAGLGVGTRLPEYRVRARNTSVNSENKIHDDSVARRFGFGGGLVPGTTVYAYMTHPIVRALGAAWLMRGSMAVRFAKPAYEGEELTVGAVVTTSVGDAAAGSLGIEVTVSNPAGDSIAVGTAGLAWGTRSEPPDPSAYPAAPLPDERPPATREVVASLAVLGSPELRGDAEPVGQYLKDVAETLALYDGPGGFLHPGFLLQQANQALSRNVHLGPWIHAASEVRYFGPMRRTDVISTRGKVAGLFERKGHELVELDLLMVAGGERPVAHVRHSAIYKPRQVG